MLKSQLLTPLDPSPFEISQLLVSNGYRFPTPQHFTHARNYLRDNGFVRYAIKGRNEYWIRVETMTEEQRKEVARNADKAGLWTVETYASHVLRMSPPFTPLIAHRIERTMLADGYVPRRRVGQPTYWSSKTQRRTQEPRKRNPPIIPNPVSYPKEPFTLHMFLAHNGMRRYVENLEWARRHLGETCHRHAGRWVTPDARGQLPVTVTGLWQAPGDAFTTAQFQRFNRTPRVTVDQWRTALAWLAANGFKFNPKFKRWVKA